MNREPQRDEAPSKAQDQFQTPQTTKSLENQKNLEEKVVTWATVPKGDNEFETIFKLSGDRFLEAMRYQFTSMRPRTYIDIQVRMFEKYGHSWMDNEKNRPHDIATLVNHQEYMVYLDKHKLLTHRFYDITSVQHLGSNMNLGRSLIPGQPNETDCGVFVMKWMELIDPTVLADYCEADKGYNIEKWAEPKLDAFRKQIVAKIVLSKDNEKRMETIRQLNEMRNIRPTAVLRSPYVQVSSADLYSK
ncbi:hypothetical protein PIB30_067068 [Stylosanthes scabra]|uniref:Ubiquitin-like protease family profile domain-containing protein n=1 Tax=Stylosanthes scabra TaxID=79078 RepID=A0ABU6YKN2_9FABA|nr:hypothetical protein [Stylosanthes scabra]